MSSTYLDLCNKVLEHFNEPRLTSSNFTTVTGFHAVVKDSVNDAIREIQQAEYQWPFNWQEATRNVTPNPSTLIFYTFNSDVETVDWDSFVLQRDDTLGVSEKKLEEIDYDTWLQTYRARDAAQIGATLGVQVPDMIFRTQDLKLGVSPISDRTYTLRWEQFVFPAVLSTYTATSSIPDRFDHVIFKGALSRCYAFRQNMPLSNWYKTQQKEGIVQMRELLINRYSTMRDNRVQRSI